MKKVPELRGLFCYTSLFFSFFRYSVGVKPVSRLKALEKWETLSKQRELAISVAVMLL